MSWLEKSYVDEVFACDSLHTGWLSRSGKNIPYEVPHQWNNSIGNVQPLLLIVQQHGELLSTDSACWGLEDVQTMKVYGRYTSSRKAHEGIDTTWKWKAFFDKRLSSFRGWSASDDGGSKGLSRQRLGHKRCPPKRKVHDCNYCSYHHGAAYEYWGKGQALEIVNAFYRLSNKNPTTSSEAHNFAKRKPKQLR